MNPGDAQEAWNESPGIVRVIHCAEYLHQHGFIDADKMTDLRAQIQWWLGHYQYGEYERRQIEATGLTVAQRRKDRRNQWQEVKHEQFKAFLEAYPRKYTSEVIRVGQPFQSYDDFERGQWPESTIAEVHSVQDEDGWQQQYLVRKDLL